MGNKENYSVHEAKAEYQAYLDTLYEGFKKHYEELEGNCFNKIKEAVKQGQECCYVKVDLKLEKKLIELGYKVDAINNPLGAFGFSGTNAFRDIPETYCKVVHGWSED